MHCLVTGGSGYLGSSLIKFILPKVSSVTNFDIIKPKNFQNEFKFIGGDICNFESILEATKNIDIIYHNVAKVQITKNKNLFTEVNEKGTKNLCCAKNLSTCSDILNLNIANSFLHILWHTPKLNSFTNHFG